MFRSFIMLFQGLLFFAVLQVAAHAEEVVGVVYPQHHLDLAIGVNGVVNKVLVKNGDFVRPQTPLVVLEQEAQVLEVKRRNIVFTDQSEIESIQSRFKILNEQLQVAEKLYTQSRSISLDEVNKLRLEIIGLEGRLLQLQVQKEREETELKISQKDLADRTLRAPIAGIVVQVAVEVGEWAKIGEPIIQLVNVDEIFVLFNLPDYLARQLKVKQQYDITFAHLGVRQALLTYIAPVADAASGLVEVRFDLKNPKRQIRPGSQAVLAL